MSSPRTLPLLVYVLAAGTFLMGTTEFLVAGLLPELATSFETTQAQAGLATTVFAVGMVIGAPLVPLVAMRVSQRRVLTVSLLVYAVAHVVTALTGDFAVLLASRLLAALATGAFWAVAAIAATAAAGRERSSSALGVVLGGGMLANVFGVPLGSLGGQLLGWRGPFWVLAVMATFMSIVIARCALPDDPAARERSVRTEVASLGSTRLWLALAICVAVQATIISVYTFVSPLLSGRAGLDLSWVPAALVLFGVASAIGSVLGGRSGDRRPFATIAVVAMVLITACTLLCLLSTSLAPSLVLFTLLGLVGLSANPVLISLVVGYGGEGAQLPSGMATAMINLGTAIGTGITGALLDTSLGTLAIPLASVAYGVLSLVPLALLTRAHRRAERCSERAADRDGGSVACEAPA